MLGNDTLGFLANAATKEGLAKELIQEKSKKMGIVDRNEILSLIMIRLSMCLKKEPGSLKENLIFYHEIENNDQNNSITRTPIKVMSNKRAEFLNARTNLSESALQDLGQKIKSGWRNAINFGSVLIVDETMLPVQHKSGLEDKVLNFNPSKPHPLGIDCKTGGVFVGNPPSPFLVDAIFKTAHQKLSPLESAQKIFTNFVHHLGIIDYPLLLIADSNFAPLQLLKWLREQGHYGIMSLPSNSYPELWSEIGHDIPVNKSRVVINIPQKVNFNQSFLYDFATFQLFFYFLFFSLFIH